MAAGRRGSGRCRCCCRRRRSLPLPPAAEPLPAPAGREERCSCCCCARTAAVQPRRCSPSSSLLPFLLLEGLAVDGGVLCDGGSDWASMQARWGPSSGWPAWASSACLASFVEAPSTPPSCSHCHPSGQPAPALPSCLPSCRSVAAAPLLRLPRPPAPSAHAPQRWASGRDTNRGAWAAHDRPAAAAATPLPACRLRVR